MTTKGTNKDSRRHASNKNLAGSRQDKHKWLQIDSTSSKDGRLARKRKKDKWRWWEGNNIKAWDLNKQNWRRRKTAHFDHEFSPSGALKSDFGNWEPSKTVTNNANFAASALGYCTLRANFKLIVKDQEFCIHSDDDQHYARFNH